MQNIQNSGSKHYLVLFLLDSRSNQLFMNDHSLEEEEEEIKKFEKTLEKCIDDSKSKAKIQPVYSREWLEQLRAMI